MAMLVRHHYGPHGSLGHRTAAWMTVGALCSGIGGFELGFQMASPSFQIKWQVEIDPFCRKVLAKHWPNVKRYEDLTTLTGDELEPVDLVCAGFPCQPVSTAGKQRGKHDHRWIFDDITRLLRVLRPNLKWVVLENTPGLFTAGSEFIESPESTFGAVLGDLASLGLDAQYKIISAADFAAPHLRRRWFCVAYANESGREEQRGGVTMEPTQRSTECRCTSHVADTTQRNRDVGVSDKRAPRQVSKPRNGCRSPRDQRFFTGSFPRQWIPEPDVGRVIPHGVPAGIHRSARLRAIGNAIVPQIAEWSGRRIIEIERDQ